MFAVFCACLFVCALRSPAGGGGGWPLGFRLWCLLWVCRFPVGVLGRVWCLIVSIPDLCTITYFSTLYLAFVCFTIGGSGYPDNKPDTNTCLKCL